MSAQVLTPREAAELLGVHHTTIRRWVEAGACPNVFADLPTIRVGIPTWWVEDRTDRPAPVVGPPSERGGLSLAGAAGSGARPNSRTDAGVTSSGAA